LLGLADRGGDLNVVGNPQRPKATCRDLLGLVAEQSLEGMQAIPSASSACGVG
jgi:hypothetical protein